MNDLKLAVMVQSLRLGLFKGMEWAAEMGIPGVHIALCDELNSKTDAAGRKAVLKKIRDIGVELSAISVWGGEVDLGETENLEKNLEEGKRTLELLVDMECGIWQGHCGVMPHDCKDPKWARFVDSFGQLSRYAEKLGVKFAIETGPEPPEILLQMIDEVGSPALNVNYDPANLIIWPASYYFEAGKEYNKEEAMSKYKPADGVKVLGKHIIHTHAKDARVFNNTEYKEVPLGEGWVDWPKYIANLREIGYDGYFAIEREVGDDPIADITKAIDFLRSL